MFYFICWGSWIAMPGVDMPLTFPKLGPYCGTIADDPSFGDRSKNAAKSLLRTWATATSSWRALPDFLIVGAKRGGTTSLYNYLLSHPQVWSMVPKKMKIKGTYYFDVNAVDRPLAWYRSHFAFKRTLERNRAVTGEATPYYLYHPQAPRRAAALVPHAKIIVILRDPVDRAWSHHRERTAQGFEELTFSEALDAEPVRTAGETERIKANPDYYSMAHQMWSYMDQGRYLSGLLEWERWYSPEQILVLRSEDLYVDAPAVLDRVHAFLGLEANRLTDTRVWNFHKKSPLSNDIRQRLVKELTDDVIALEDHLGSSMNWRSFS